VSIALLDANVLIALLDPEHQHHNAAHTWLSANTAFGFAVCPLVENTCLRIMCQPSYPKCQSFNTVRTALQSLRALDACHFWADSVSLVDSACLAAGAMLAPATVTDTYLLALAVSHGGRLATFDRRIAWQNVVGATLASLWVLQ
jgi:uncharacterized protein